MLFFVYFYNKRFLIRKIEFSLEKSLEMERYIKFDDPNFANNLIENYRRDGVAVITGVFSSDYCNTAMNNIVSYIETVNPVVNRNQPESWSLVNLGPQVRTGLFQALYCNQQAVWDLRSHSNVRKIFETLYSNLRGKTVTDFVVSCDGINIKHNEVGPYQYDKIKDWPHLDQTDRSDIYLCVQGQAVLTETTACFRCTPGSHKSFIQVLNETNVSENDKSNWKKFTPAEIEKIKPFFGNNWQLDIRAPKGSFIVWSSSTIHSATFQKQKEPKLDGEPWKGWRGVVYICYRPKNEVTNQHKKRLRKCVDENRVTNHWGSRLFGKRPGERWKRVYHNVIEPIVNDPQKIYNIHPKIVLSNSQQSLIN